MGSGTKDFPRLFSPIRVGARELRNRAVLTAHGAFQPWNPADDGSQYMEYQRRRVSGGVSMTIIQPIMVEPDPSWCLVLAERMRRLADAIRAEGAITVLQIVNFGGQMSALYNRGERALWSFNGMQARNGEVSHRMSAEQIELMIEAYAETARIATDAGIDGIELHGAHGYLIDQSLSRWGNGRDDDWGEPLAFVRAVIERTREAIGPDKLLGLRLNQLDDQPRSIGGRTADELRTAAARIVAAGGLDFLNTSIGSRAPDYMALAVGSYREKPGYELDLTRQTRAAIGAAIPVIGCGRIADPALGEQALENGACDIVGFTRASLSDPDFVSKVARGEGSRIRPCVAANECTDRRQMGLPISCFHNPDVGREGRGAPARAVQPKRVVVVGAGPAGLKSAEIAALRGHEVQLFDRAAEAGGYLRHVRATRAGLLYGAVEHLVHELGHLGVPIRLGRSVDEDLLAELRPDHVVLATGAVANVFASFPGADGPRVLAPADALAQMPEGSIMVLDRLGAQEAGIVVEAFAAAGRKVTYVTPFETFCPRAGNTQRLDLAPVFRKFGVEVVTEADILHVDDRQVALVDPDGRERLRLDVDTIVPVEAPVPELHLESVLARLAIPFSVVGDARAPRGVLVAMRDADDVARAL